MPRCGQQETDRHYISENVDERTMFEMYYPPFEGAISAGLGSVMCSYNIIGVDLPAGFVGNWSCMNGATLQRDLKHRLGFDGVNAAQWLAPWL
jgi:beta-glucosidase